MQPSAGVSSSTADPALALPTQPPAAGDLPPSAAEQAEDPLRAAGLRAVDDRVRSFVAERPAVALLGAVAVGFVVGRLLSRV